MSRTVKWILISVAVILVVFLTVRLIAGSGTEAVEVTAETAKRTTITQTVSASGKIYPENEVRLGAGISGEVVELNVQEGDTVKSGQVLARIKTDGNRGTQLNLGQLRNFVPDISTTSSSGTVTIKSPMSGIVTSVNIRKGERTGGMQTNEMIRVADLSAIELRADVSENDIIKVAKGDAVEVEIDAYPKRNFSGVVTSIANSTQRRDATPFSAEITSYEVRIRIDTSSYSGLLHSGKSSFPFRSGMNARASIKTQVKQNILAVPVSAVSSREKQKSNKTETVDAQFEVNSSELEEYVYVIDDQNVVNSKVIETGIQDINHFEVLAGLKDGEKVVTGPYSAITKNLKDGMKVKIVSKEALFNKQ